jgi:predicted DNA-binding transcriptional regulator YafY
MQLDRMLQIHEALRRNDFPTQQQLAADLSYDRQTIIADMRFMQTRLHMPLEYCAEKRGWGYTQPMVEFPLLYITEEELIALCVAVRALASFPGTMFFDVIRRILSKLEYSIRDRLKFSLDEVESAISFGSAAAPAVDSHVYQQFTIAALNGEEVECTYAPLLGGGAPRRRVVQPVHVTTRNNAWYVLVQDARRKQKIATYKLSRMTAVQRTGRAFQKLNRTEWESTLAGSVGIYSGAVAEQVRLRLTPLGVKLIGEQPMHASQEIAVAPDGSGELSMRVPITPELERLVLSWGAEIRVLEPQALGERIRETARKVALA